MILWKFLMITSISLGTAALYRVPRQLISWCGLIGGIAGSMVLTLSPSFGQGFSTFFAAFTVGMISEFLARNKKSSCICIFSVRVYSVGSWPLRLFDYATFCRK